jgi:signal transduction histidine kinase
MPHLVTNWARWSSRRSYTLVATGFGLCAVLAIGLWDIHKDDALALRRLEREHYRIARTLSQYMAQGSRCVDQDAKNPGSEMPVPGVVKRDADQDPSESQVVVLYLSDSESKQYLPASKRWVQIPELTEARYHGGTGAVLSRESASRLGLPHRIAVAGLAALNPGSHDFSAVSVVASAEAERDRSRRDQWRSVLGVAIASALVLVAGVATLRRQKRDLQLEQERALRRLERSRDTELARANRMATVAALSSGIAHEIATPLSVIAGRIEQLLVAAHGNTKLVATLETIASQIGRIDKIMRGFLAFARGSTPLLFQQPANDVAREVAGLVQYPFGNAGVSLELEIDPSNPMIACDPALFEQALLDIVTNALEASTTGQIVRLAVESDEHHVYFRITDQGVGITDTALTRVTEPFYTTKANRGGSGLGLAIAKEILNHHAGTLTFELPGANENGAARGTRVSLQLPRNKEPAGERQN